MAVYFIQDAHGNVKIGFSLDVTRRFQTMQAAHVSPLLIMRIVPGGPAAERWYQSHFAAQHICREWFDFHSEMLTVVAPADITAILPPRMRKMIHDDHQSIRPPVDNIVEAFLHDLSS